MKMNSVIFSAVIAVIIIFAAHADAQVNLMQDDFVLGTGNIQGTTASQTPGSTTWSVNGQGTIAEDGEYADLTTGTNNVSGYYAVPLASGNVYTIRINLLLNVAGTGNFAFGFTDGTTLGGKHSANSWPWIELSQEGSIAGTGSGGSYYGWVGGSSNVLTEPVPGSDYGSTVGTTFTAKPVEATIIWDTNQNTASFYLNDQLMSVNGSGNVTSFPVAMVSGSVYAFIYGTNTGTSSPAPMQIQSVTVTEQASTPANGVWIADHSPSSDSKNTDGHQSWWNPLFTAPGTPSSWPTTLSFAKVWNVAGAFFQKGDLSQLVTFFEYCHANNIKICAEIGGLPLLPNGQPYNSGSSEPQSDFTTMVSHIAAAKATTSDNFPYQLDYVTLINPFNAAIVVNPPTNPFNINTDPTAVQDMAQAIATNITPLVQAYPALKIGESQMLSTVLNAYDNSNPYVDYVPYYEKWITSFATDTIPIPGGTYNCSINHTIAIDPATTDPYFYGGNCYGGAGESPAGIIKWLRSQGDHVMAYLHFSDWNWPTGSFTFANNDYTESDLQTDMATMEHIQCVNASAFPQDMFTANVAPWVDFESYGSNGVQTAYPAPSQTIPESQPGTLFYGVDYYFLSPEATQPPPVPVLYLTGGTGFCFTTSVSEANNLGNNAWALDIDESSSSGGIGHRAPYQLNDPCTFWGAYTLPDSANGVEPLYRYVNKSVNNNQGSYALSTTTSDTALTGNHYAVDTSVGNNAPLNNNGVIGYVWDASTGAGQGGRYVYEYYNSVNNTYYYSDDSSTSDLPQQGANWAVQNGGAAKFFGSPVYNVPPQGTLSPGLVNPVWKSGAD
jgi:hypothetical protein